MNFVHCADNLDVLKTIPDSSVDLIYIDPPFNTGKIQSYTRLKGKQKLSKNSFHDSFTDYLEFLEPRIVEAHRILKDTGSFYFHIDYREVHYCKVLIDMIFGRENFINDIIWCYDYGARSKNKWPTKHDNILFYAKDATKYVFNYDAIDKIPYMAPGLQKDPTKAAAGKTPTDAWWMTIVPTQGKERVGYPTQKPIALVKRIILASSPVGGSVLDFFAGSGTTGVAVHELGRTFTLIDSNQAAIDIMKKRFVDLAINDVQFL